MAIIPLIRVNQMEENIILSTHLICIMVQATNCHFNWSKTKSLPHQCL